MDTKSTKISFDLMLILNRCDNWAANELSPTFKSVMFASARSNCPNFFFQILIEEGQRTISILISTRYRAYQDAFQARKNTQLLQFP